MKKLLFLMLIFLLMHWSASASGKGRSRLLVTRSGNGPDVVLLPGIGCPGAVFAGLVSALAPVRCCHVLQIPGFAGQGIAGSEAADDWVLEVAGYLSSQRLSDITLIGHSFGGWLALRVAAQAQTVSRLIVIDAAPFAAGLFQDVSPQHAVQQAGQLRDLLANLSAEQYQAFEARRLSLLVADPASASRVLPWLLATPRPLLARLSVEMAGSDLRPLLPGIKAATLVLASWTMGRLFGLDRFGVESRLREQYNALQGCIIHMADRAGHFIMLDEPRWLEREVLSFLVPK